jgi:hypothetical protein
MLRRLAAALLIATTALSVPVRTVAAAGNGLTFASTTTYTVDAATSTVHVSADMTMTNTVADTRQGSIIYRHYFTGFSLPVPVGALNAGATQNGRPVALAPRLIPNNSNFFVFDVKFAANLYHGQTAHVIVTYDITGQPPRSRNPSRVNGAYAAFDAFGVGDQGKVTVRVVVPAGFVTDTFGNDATVTSEGSNTVYTATNIPNPDQFDIFVSTRNDGALTHTEVRTASADDFDLRAWPGDTAWQQFVTTQINDGVPQLATLIGQRWPIGNKVEVREAYTPYLYGYAGWFSATKDQIEIGEDLDRSVVLHELSHAWFNDDWFRDRWINEGFAQVYSNAAVKALGGDAITPTAASPSDPGAVRLQDWGDPKLTTGADQVEKYGYNASYWVLQQVVDEVGLDKMRAVFAAVQNGTGPYAGDVITQKSSGATDWTRLLDLLDEVAGSKKADQLFRDDVVDSAGTARLDARDSARAAYAALAEHGGKWEVPAGVRTDMDSWQFGEANTRIMAADKVLDLRDRLDKATAALGLTYPDSFFTDYINTPGSDFSKVTDELQHQLDAADTLSRARAADAAHHGFFARVGLMGKDVKGDLDTAAAAFRDGNPTAVSAAANRALDTISGAAARGRRRVELAVGGALLLLLVLLAATIIILRRRRDRRRKAASTFVAEPPLEPALAAEPQAASSDNPS